MRKRSAKIMLATVLGTVMLGAGIATPLALKNANKVSEAITTTDTTSYVSVGELWNSDSKAFNKGNIDILYKYLTGNASASYDNVASLASSTTTAANIRSKTLSAGSGYSSKSSSQDVIVTLGGLKWEVVYLSNDTDGEPVLTLWLSNSTQDAFSGRSSTEGQYYGYLNGGLYSDWSSNLYNYYFTVNYPTNMYGTSYIRAVTLNNGGAYVSSISVSGSTAGAVSTLSTATKSTSNVFAPFTMDSYGLTEYIVTPNKMSWQKDQSSITTVGETYTYANEALGTPTRQNIYTSGSYGKVSDMFGNRYYSAWGEDKLWLPSLAETGYSDSGLGMWGVSVSQRQNYNGSTTYSLGSVGSTSGNAYAYSWLRSGFYYISSNAYFLNPSGASNGSAIVDSSHAVRPALHLNLKSVNDSIPDIWDDYASDSYAGGSGTETDPYQISTAEELALLAVNTRDAGVSDYYKLTANIDLRDHVWNGIAHNMFDDFAGVFDGDYHTISGMTMIGNADNMGLFYCVSGTIKNLFLIDSTIINNERSSYIGGIVGNAYDTLIENCVCDNIYINSNSTCGGIVGTAGGSTTILNCIFKNGNIFGNESGGIVGIAEANSIKTTNCSVTNTKIQGTSKVYVLAPDDVEITASYGEVMIISNGSTGNLKRVMYGTESDWGDWGYNASLNGGYPIQTALLHIGGNISDSATVYNRLKELRF